MPTVALSTTTLNYVDRGHGLPVLVVHGFPLDHTMWSAQIDVLANSCRVIAPDMRGFGGSLLGRIDPSVGVSMEQYANDLVELLDLLAVKEPVVLAGFSMGGYIAWQYVRKYSGRLRGLVLCDTRADADSEEGRAGRLKMAEHVAEWGSGRVAEIMGPRLFAPQSFSSRADAVASVRQVVESTDPAAIAAAQRGMAARGDMRGLLPQIEVSTMVVVGEHDVISPPEVMRSIAAAIPRAHFAVIPDAGHMTTMENPDAMNEALQRFVASLSGQTGH